MVVGSDVIEEWEGCLSIPDIRGRVPDLLDLPAGCRFNPRCPYAFNRCIQEDPQLMPVPGVDDHLQACFLDEDTKSREAAKTLSGVAA